MQLEKLLPQTQLKQISIWNIFLDKEGSEMYGKLLLNKTKKIYALKEMSKIKLIKKKSVHCTVFDAVQSPPLSSPPCKFGKILVVDNFVEKNYFENFRIRNYLKKDFLNFSFHYIRYCNHLVTFLEKISHQFALIFQALNEVSQSNIFLVFFC